MFQSIVDGMILFDSNICYVAWNPAMERITGVKAEQVLGRYAYDVFPFLLEIGEDKYINQALKGESCRSIRRSYYVPETNRQGFFEATYSPLYDENQQVNGVFAIVREITEETIANQQIQQHLQEEIASSEERFRILFEQVPLGMMIFSLSGDCLQVNHSFQDAWQINFEQLQNYNIFNDPLVKSKGLLPYIERAFQGEVVWLPPTYYDPAVAGIKGKIRCAEGIYFPIKSKDGQLLELAVILNDITESEIAKEELKQAYEQFRSLADSMPQIVWVCDAEGELIYCNQRWVEYAGYTLGKSQNWGWLEMLHPDDKAICKAVWQKATKDGSIPEMECRYKRQDGKYRWHLVRAVPIRNTAGAVVKWFGTSTDIHDQKSHAERLQKAIQEAREWQDVLETVNNVGRIIAAELNLECLVQAVIDAAVKLSKARFGAFFYQTTDEEGKTQVLHSLSGVSSQVFEKFSSPHQTGLFRITFAEKQVICSADITRDPQYQGIPSGHLTVKSYLAVPIVSRLGKVIGSLFLGHEEPGIFTDREEKLVIGLAAQAAIAMDNAHLYRQSQDAIKAREQFLSIASHELKTPLTTLQLQIESLRRAITKNDAEQTLPQRFKFAIDTCYQQATRLSNLIEVLLDISHIDAKQLPLSCEQIELNSVIQEIVEQQKDLTGVHIKIDINEEIIGCWDKIRIEQVITNLISNAIKYAEDAAIVITAKKIDERAIIKVKDLGQGIASSDQEKIFQRYERVKKNKEIGGLGLGLYITRQLVEAHAGSIQVESEIGQGTVFTIDLPLDTPA